MITVHETVDNPELVIGLVGPIGVDMDAVIKHLERSLANVKYVAETVHLTKVMEEILPQYAPDPASYQKRYLSLIAHADNLRKEVNNQAALACIAISEIVRRRGIANLQADEKLELKKARATPALGRAYILRQFKREEEITLLRQVYGRKFIQVSVFLDKEERKQHLIRKIQSFGTGIVDDVDAEKAAIDLIAIDNNEVGNDFGQRVSDVFHLGDVFVRGEATKDSEETIERFVQALFGHNGLSPTRAEYGMYAAAGAALRSLDLSRQVGAAVFSDRGEVITLGCNEVPKAFGGTYWADDPECHRDFEEGSDGNHQRKLRVVHDLLERMGALGFLSPALTSSGDTAKQVQKLLSEETTAESRIMDIIEFGRIIHAEMSAITDAARLGKSLAGSVLYCTTFPCHMCAKHIVSAGIKRVIFLEPYPKSHAKDLHADSITFSPSEQAVKVLFEPFIGISPRRYRDIFEKRKRKNKDGKAVPWSKGKAVPSIEDTSSSYIENEEPAMALISSRLDELAGKPVSA